MNPTTCAVCSAALPHQAPAQSCRRCQTRLCGEACLKQHNKSKGECKKIQRAGGAQQYYANEQYAAAAAVAVEKCAGDAAGKTCYICLAGDNLVRGCACRGEWGFVHLSCLVRQARVACAEAAEEAVVEASTKWYKCSLCKQDYHGVVGCAVSWAGWATYMDQSPYSLVALENLGVGQMKIGKHEEALNVFRAMQAMYVSRGLDPVYANDNVAICLRELGRLDEALELTREYYTAMKKSKGAGHYDTLRAVNNLADLCRKSRTPNGLSNACMLLRFHIPIATSNFGPEHPLTMRMRENLVRSIMAKSTWLPEKSSKGDLFEAQTIIEDLVPMIQRVYGADHPLTREVMETEFVLLDHLEIKAMAEVVADGDRLIREGHTRALLSS